MAPRDAGGFGNPPAAPAACRPRGTPGRQTRCPKRGPRRGSGGGRPDSGLTSGSSPAESCLRGCCCSLSNAHFQSDGLSGTTTLPAAPARCCESAEDSLCCPNKWPRSAAAPSHGGICLAQAPRLSLGLSVPSGVGFLGPGWGPAGRGKRQDPGSVGWDTTAPQGRPERRGQPEVGCTFLGKSWTLPRSPEHL